MPHAVVLPCGPVTITSVQFPSFSLVPDIERLPTQCGAPLPPPPPLTGCDGPEGMRRRRLPPSPGHVLGPHHALPYACCTSSRHRSADGSIEDLGEGMGMVAGLGMVALWTGIKESARPSLARPLLLCSGKLLSMVALQCMLLPVDDLSAHRQGQSRAGLRTPAARLECPPVVGPRACT